MEVDIETIIISGFTAIVVVLLKDYYAPILLKSRLHKVNKRLILLQYSEPLSNSLLSLKHRLNEVRDKEINLDNELVNKHPFDSYKHISTIYRIACVFGWLSAIDKETSLVHLSGKAKYKEVTDAINKLRNAFADGGSLEVMRFEEFVRVLTDKKQSFVGEKYIIEWFETTRRKILVDLSTKEGVSIDLLRVSKIDSLITKIPESTLNEIKSTLNDKVPNIDASLVQNTDIANALAAIHTKEAWIYRDWQNAIGDLMLVPSEVVGIKYSVMSFLKFEEFIKIEDGKQENNSVWIDRLCLLIRNIDWEDSNLRESRVGQMDSILSAIEDLLVKIASLPGMKHKK